MRCLLIILFFLVDFLSKAQTDFSLSNFELQDSSIKKIGLWTEQSYNSNVINNNVFFSLATNRGPSYNSLQNIKTRLLKINRAGYTGIERIYLTQKLDSKKDSVKLSSFFSLHSFRQLAAKFGDDPLRLLAYGNKAFAGKSAQITPLNLTLQQFTAIQFGVAKTKRNKTLGIAPSLILGNRYNEINSEEGFLYTSPIGDSIYAEAKGNWTQSDTSSNLIYEVNGIGVAIDIYYTIPVNFIKKDKQLGSLTFELNNFGFLVWNKNTQNYTIEGTYNWDGFKPPNLFDLNDSIIDLQRPNDIQNSFLKKFDQGTKNKPLPFRLSIKLQERLNNKVLLVATLEQQFFSHSLPYISLNQIIRANKETKNTAVNLNFYQSFGGYNIFGLGTGITITNSKYDLTLGTRNLFSILSSTYFGGFNAHCGFYWKLY